jgi:4-hydroxy-2-oxoheptanedioate aldolase
MSNSSFKERLRAGQLLLGPIVMECASPGLALTLADVGFDFILLDLEHAPFDNSTVARTILAGRQAGLSSIVKLPDLERSGVQRFLDYGAAAVQVPHVESPDEVARLLRWGLYPPLGQRGFAPGLGSTDFRPVEAAAQIKAANENVLLIPMIETRAGVENAEAILSAAQIDLVYIGASDLSSSFGVPGQLHHPLILQAVERVISLCRKRGIAVGINAEDLERARYWVERGVQLIAYSSDLGLIRSQARLFLQEKGSLEKAAASAR